MGVGLQVTVDDIDNKKVLRIEGRIDANTVPILERHINEQIDADNLNIILDFDKVDYLSSAGLRLLLSVTKKLKNKNGHLVCCEMSEEVLEIVKMAGFDRILKIYSNEEDALRSLE